MSSTEVAVSPIQAAYDRIKSVLNNNRDFAHEREGVLYSKDIPGSQMSLDQWIEIKDGVLLYTSRLMQLNERHPSYPCQAEFQTPLTISDAEVLAKAWAEEARLSSEVASLRSSLDAYRRDYI